MNFLYNFICVYNMAQSDYTSLTYPSPSIYPHQALVTYPSPPIYMVQAFPL